MSIQRNVDLHDLDRFGPARNSPRNSPAVRRKTEPPLPPNKKKVEEPQVRTRWSQRTGGEIRVAECG